MTQTAVAKPDDDLVEIRLTETIVAGDLKDDIEMKGKRLLASLARHGVAAENVTIVRDFIGAHDCLIGTGRGPKIEMTEEQEKRRQKENEAAAQSAIVTIAKSIEAKQNQDSGGDALGLQAALAAKDKDLEKALADKDAEAAKALAAKDAEIEKLKKK